MEIIGIASSSIELTPEQHQAIGRQQLLAEMREHADELRAEGDEADYTAQIHPGDEYTANYIAKASACYRAARALLAFVRLIEKRDRKPAAAPVAPAQAPLSPLAQEGLAALNEAASGLESGGS